jgi:hypothetical protein
MNGADFLMQHIGYRLLPKAMHTGDAVTDANALFSISLPLLILAIGKSPMYARDLFVTYDPRATRYCSDGSLRTVDSTLEKWWTP